MEKTVQGVVSSEGTMEEKVENPVSRGGTMEGMVNGNVPNNGTMEEMEEMVNGNVPNEGTRDVGDGVPSHEKEPVSPGARMTETVIPLEREYAVVWTTDKQIRADLEDDHFLQRMLRDEGFHEIDTSATRELRDGREGSQ
jgi:hypothetical protein